jgi:ABC-type polysaccharide/polyol phosphate export permease
MAPSAGSHFPLVGSKVSGELLISGWQDLLQSGRKWRIWVTLAWNDIARRYRRSVIGQFWLTLSMGITVLGLGLVYSTLFRLDIASYLPYVAVTFVLWALISGTLVEACNAFIDAEGLIKHASLPRAMHPIRVITRNLIGAAHNVLIVPVVFLILGYGISFSALWIILTLPLLLANLLWMGLLLAIVCARYRDVPQIVASLMQILFFITPVMFKPEQLAGRVGWIVEWNPFANLLAIVRDPLLGYAPSEWALIVSVAMALLGWAWTLSFVGRYGPRVPYWL